MINTTIGILMLAGWLTAVMAGMAPAAAAEHALDLSDPQTITRITGSYEGRWVDDRSGRHGTLLVTFSSNPKGGEKPFVRDARVLGSSTIDPHKTSRVHGKVEQNALLFSSPSGWSRYRFVEEHGQVKARGEYRYETGPMAGHGGTQTLVHVGEGSGAPAPKSP